MIAIGKSPKQIREEIGNRFKQERLMHNYSRETLSEKSGIPVSTIRKFEDTGEISFKSLISIIHSLGRIEEIENFMLPKSPQTLIELKNKKRLRGSK